MTFTTRNWILYALLIFTICLIAHHRLPSQPWSYDDLDHISSTQRVHEQGVTTLFQRDVKEPTRWLLNIYYYIAYALFGNQPAGYHAVNIPLHALAAWLCAYLLFALFTDHLLAGVSGFLFAIHGAPYEAIYEISATGILIGTIAALLSVYFAHRYITSHRLSDAISAGIAYAAALFSYESLASIVVPILYLWWTRGNRKRYTLPIALIIPVVFFLFIDTFIYRTTEGKVAFNAFSLGWHIPYNFLFFWGRLFLNAHTTPFGWDGPPPFDIKIGHFDHTALIGGALFVLFTGISLRHSKVRFATLWICATILPYTFGSDRFYFSRYWYLPAVGGAFIEALCITSLTKRIPTSVRSKQALTGLILIMITSASLKKMHYFEGRFLMHAANFHLDHRHDAASAVAMYERARDEYGIQQAMLYLHLSLAYTETRQYGKAFETIQTLFQKSPNSIKGKLLLSHIAFSTQNFKLALEALISACRQDREQITELHTLAKDLNSVHQTDLSFQAYREILVNFPEYGNLNDCYLEISDLLYQQGQRKEAIDILHELLKTHPNFEAAKQQLNNLQSQKEPR